MGGPLFWTKFYVKGPPFRPPDLRSPTLLGYVWELFFWLGFTLRYTADGFAIRTFQLFTFLGILADVGLCSLSPPHSRSGSLCHMGESITFHVISLGPFTLPRGTTLGQLRPLQAEAYVTLGSLGSLARAGPEHTLGAAALAGYGWCPALRHVEAHLRSGDARGASSATARCCAPFLLKRRKGDSSGGSMRASHIPPL